MAPLGELDGVRGETSGDRAAVVCGIQRREELQRSEICGGRLSGVRTRDGGFAETAFGAAPRKLAADSDVQRAIAFAEPVQLRRAGFVRGLAAAGIHGRNSVTVQNRLLYSSCEPSGIVLPAAYSASAS